MMGLSPFYGKGFDLSVFVRILAYDETKPYLFLKFVMLLFHVCVGANVVLNKNDL